MVSVVSTHSYPVKDMENIEHKNLTLAKKSLKLHAILGTLATSGGSSTVLLSYGFEVLKRGKVKRHS